MYFVWNTDIRIQVIFLCTVAGDKKETMRLLAGLHNLVFRMQGTEFHVTWLKSRLLSGLNLKFPSFVAHFRNI